VAEGEGFGLAPPTENKQLTDFSSRLTRSILNFRAQLERNWNIAFSSLFRIAAFTE